MYELSGALWDVSTGGCLRAKAPAESHPEPPLPATLQHIVPNLVGPTHLTVDAAVHTCWAALGSGNDVTPLPTHSYFIFIYTVMKNRLVQWPEDVTKADLFF